MSHVQVMTDPTTCMCESSLFVPLDILAGSRELADRLPSCDYCGAVSLNLDTPEAHILPCPVPDQLRQADAILAIVAEVID